MKAITDKAEVSIDFPEKTYIGSFGRDSAFSAEMDETGVRLKIVRHGDERRTVEIHLHYYLFADIVSEVAAALAEHPLDEAHRGPLADSVKALQHALAKGRGKRASP